MLLEALVACAGVSLKAAATMLDIPLEVGDRRAEGDVDLSRHPRRLEDVPARLTEIRFVFDVDTDVLRRQGVTSCSAWSSVSCVAIYNDAEQSQNGCATQCGEGAVRARAPARYVPHASVVKRWNACVLPPEGSRLLCDDRIAPLRRGRYTRTGASRTASHLVESTHPCRL